MTTTTPTKRKLRADEARRLHDAEVTAARAKRALEHAEADRNALRTKYLGLIPLSQDPEDLAASSEIRELVAGGVRVRVAIAAKGASTFSLAKYREAGHAITTAMAPFVGKAAAKKTWTVDRAAGPTNIHAVDDPA